MTRKKQRQIMEAVYRQPSTTDFSEIWAVDFDGTIVTNKYPRIGEPNTALIQRLRQAQREGVGLILWTCRTGIALQEAVRFCAAQGLVFDAVNENLPCIKSRFGTDPRKVYAHKYIDDRSCQPATL